MKDIKLPLLLLLAVLAAAPASAQSPAPAAKAGTVAGLPVESVTVLGIKPSQDTIRNFVETRSVPTHALNRMALWTLKICPLTVGLGDKYAQYVNQRIRQVAAAVGAPVDPDPACRPNVEVVFTTTPQALMNNIRKTDPVYLGFYYLNSEADALAKVTHPVQAWYTTLSQPYYEHRQLKYSSYAIDVGKCPVGGGIAIKTDNSHEFSLPCFTGAGLKTSGSRAEDGAVSSFFNVLIVAEPAKLYDFEIGSVADYITMLALSQPTSLDVCPELPSISNMLATDCASTTVHITDGDLAYLRTLYKLPGGNPLSVQRDYLRAEMYQTLVTDKGG